MAEIKVLEQHDCNNKNIENVHKKSVVHHIIILFVCKSVTETWHLPSGGSWHAFSIKKKTCAETAD